MNVSIELDREVDGRWIAEVPALPGVIVYGGTRSEAIAKAKALALHVIADRIENGEETGDLVSLTFAAA
jgi:predicted RNase H-like HicB family nuclease